ncbi:MAG: hypothetical protein NTV62_01355, partial [Candidatus Gribaldobacteria bacterium]|nr:hypothetical protein [Candidatus Gribaldobacteria bacterium]
AIQLRENLQAEYAKIRAEFITDRLAEDKALALAFGGDEAVAINYANEKDAVKKANLLVGIINEYMATKNTNTTDPRVDEALKIAKSAKVVADLADTKSQTAMSKATTALVVADTTKITLASEVDDRVN